jgi:hypothetical protein
MDMKTIRGILAVACCVAAAPASAQLVIPNTFSAGTPARAQEVNANFAAVKVAVDAKAPISSPTFTGTVTAPTFSGNLNGNAATATSAQTAQTATSATTATTANGVAANVVTPSDLNASAAPTAGQVPSRGSTDTFTWVTPVTHVNATGALTTSTSGTTVTVSPTVPVSPVVTPLDPPQCTVLSSVGSTPTLHTTLGTFTKSYALSSVRITYQGHFKASIVSGTGVGFQLRVDGATPSGGGLYYYFLAQSGSEQWATIDAYFGNLGVGNHSVQLYAWDVGGTASNVYQDPGCWDPKVIVSEN